MQNEKLDDFQFFAYIIVKKEFRIKKRAQIPLPNDAH